MKKRHVTTLSYIFIFLVINKVVLLSNTPDQAFSYLQLIFFHEGLLPPPDSSDVGWSVCCGSYKYREDLHLAFARLGKGQNH